MIILDTNVLSEVLRPVPDTGVLRWVAANYRRGLYTTAISQAEILQGVSLLPVGRRRTALAGAVSILFSVQFQGRVLPFDEAAAPAFAEIVAARNRAGRPISQYDAMIAAIARIREASVATRDSRGFEKTGVRTVNPWAEAE